MLLPARKSLLLAWKLLMSMDFTSVLSSFCLVACSNYCDSVWYIGKKGFFPLCKEGDAPFTVLSVHFPDENPALPLYDGV